MIPAAIVTLRPYHDSYHDSLDSLDSLDFPDCLINDDHVNHVNHLNHVNHGPNTQSWQIRSLVSNHVKKNVLT